MWAQFIERNLSDVGISSSELGVIFISISLLTYGGYMRESSLRRPARTSPIDKRNHIIPGLSIPTNYDKDIQHRLFSLPGLCQYPRMVNALFPLTPDLLRKLHPSSNSSPRSLQIITPGHGWPLVVVAGSGGGNLPGVINHAHGTLYIRILMKLLLGSKSMGEVSHSTQHMPALLYFNWSHWSNIKTYLITADLPRSLHRDLEAFQMIYKWFVKCVYLYNSFSLRQYIFVPFLPLKGS